MLDEKISSLLSQRFQVFSPVQMENMIFITQQINIMNKQTQPHTNKKQRTKKPLKHPVSPFYTQSAGESFSFEARYLGRGITSIFCILSSCVL